MTRRFDAVVFDNDGLLLDTEEAWTRAEQRLFAARGREFTPADKRDLLGNAAAIAERKLERMLEEPGRGPALLLELGALALEEIGRHAPPRAGALELLARLREAAIPAALASNSPRALVECALATAGIEQAVFASILTADGVASPKPAPDIYLETCAALRTEPARTLVLEDSPTGVAAAVAAGCFTVAVPSIAGVDVSAAAVVVESLAAAELRRLLGL